MEGFQISNLDTVLNRNANEDGDSASSSVAVDTNTESGVFQKGDTSATVTGKVIERKSAPSVVSSVGSYAPTLANVASRASGTADVSVDLPIQSLHSDGGGESASSVGMDAPTLATRRTARTAASTSGTLCNKILDIGDREKRSVDGSTNVSSVGSEAPTLTTKASKYTAATKATLRDKTFETTNDGDDVVSSVGSEAPTLATKKSIATLRNKFIEAGEEDDAVSSVGSGAPTLATKRSVKTAATSTTMRNKSVNLDKGDDVSELGSRAPTLSGKSKAKSSLRPSSYGKKKKVIKELKPSYEDSIAGDSGLSFDHYASDMALLGGVLGREDLTSGLEDVVGTFLRHGAIVGFVVWIVLLIATVLVAPLSSYQYMNGPEQMANAALLTLLVGVNTNRLGPLLVNERNWKFLTSGAMTASLIVQFIATVTVAAMLLLPTPVVIDPIIGIRCHLVRWAEWTACTFIMTFLTESIDLPLENADSRSAWAIGTFMALSTLGGAVLAFCPNETWWLAVIATSVLLFCFLYLRLLVKGWRLQKMNKGDTTSEKEDYERARYGFLLLSICAVVWTILVLAWLGCAAAARFAPPGSFLANDWLVLVVENFAEGLSKVLYLSILMEAHAHLFDEVSRTARRLGELRSYMSAVWDASNDVVIICSSHDHLVNAAVSPAIFQMEYGFGLTPNKSNDNDQRTLVMEVDPYESSYRTFEMDLTKPMTRNEANKMMMNSRNKARLVTPAFAKNLKVLSDLVCDACTVAVPEGQKQTIVKKDFYYQDKEKTLQKLSCSAKIVRLKGKAFLIVLQDVSQNPSVVPVDHPRDERSVASSSERSERSNASSEKERSHSSSEKERPVAKSRQVVDVNESQEGGGSEGKGQEQNCFACCIM